MTNWEATDKRMAGSKRPRSADRATSISFGSGAMTSANVSDCADALAATRPTDTSAARDSPTPVARTHTLERSCRRELGTPEVSQRCRIVADALVSAVVVCGRK